MWLQSTSVLVFKTVSDITKYITHSELFDSDSDYLKYLNTNISISKLLNMALKLEKGGGFCVTFILQIWKAFWKTATTTFPLDILFQFKILNWIEQGKKAMFSQWCKWDDFKEHSASNCSCDSETLFLFNSLSTQF